MVGDTQSYVIRIWHEAIDEEGRVIAWRGSIDHVGNDTRLHFQELEKLVDFIRQESRLEGQEVRLDQADLV